MYFWKSGFRKSLKLAAFLLFGFGLLVAVPSYAELRPSSSTPHLLVDADSGKVLARNKAFVRWAPASLTKLMTAYTVFRALELQHLAMNSPVRISETALAQPPSKMGFPIGTVLTIESALKIIMVKSANDVSVALGEAVAGSEAQFTRFMNAHARRLGMDDTKFENSHGLHHPNQYTSARDMALLALAIDREFPQYAGFFDIPALRVVGRRLRNHNALLRLFDGTNGMKTGYVCASGYNVIVRTEREGRRLVAVVLGQRSGFKRSVAAAELLTQGFETDAEQFRPVLSQILRPAGISILPVDLTRQICPRKNPERVVPVARPAEAPSSEDFDRIDAQVLIDPDQTKVSDPGVLPVPSKRPFRKFIAAASAAIPLQPASKANPGTEKATPDTGLTVKEKAKLYLKPRTDLRADVRVRLGGGTGPNPFGLKHTNGSVYKPQIPVPQLRPALDLKATQE